MKLLSKHNGEQLLEILCQTGDRVTVQFVNEQGGGQGKPFNDKLSGLYLAGWMDCTASVAIGLRKFSQGVTEDADVSLALHQAYPLGRKIRLPDGTVGTIASYANTHADGYYMFLLINGEVERLKMQPNWRLVPAEKLLALPYYPNPRSEQELSAIAAFDQWAGGF